MRGGRSDWEGQSGDTGTVMGTQWGEVDMSTCEINQITCEIDKIGCEIQIARILMK